MKINNDIQESYCSNKICKLLEEAAKLALECGQIEKLQYSSDELFSEDLY